MKEYRIVGTDHGVFCDVIITAKDRADALEQAGIQFVHLCTEK